MWWCDVQMLHTMKLADLFAVFRSWSTHININFQLCFWLPYQWTCTLSPALVCTNYWEKYLCRLHFWLCSALPLLVALSVCPFFFFFKIFCFKTFLWGWWVKRLWLNHSANVKTVELKQARIGWKAQGHQHYEGDFHTAKSKIDWILSMLQTLTTRLVQSFSAPLHLIWTRGQWSHTLPGQ